MMTSGGGKKRENEATVKSKRVSLMVGKERERSLEVNIEKDEIVL